MTRTWEAEAYRDSRTPGPVTLHLRWTERPAGTSSGRWQVTTLDPPMSAEAWEHPPALFATGDVGPLDGGGEFDISFTPGRPLDARAASPAMAAAPAPNSVAPSAPAQPTPRMRLSRVTTPSAAAVMDWRAVAGAVARPILNPNRFYVRIVGLDGAGQPVGLPSNSIVLTWSPPGTLDHYLTEEEIRKANAEAAARAAAAAIARLTVVSFVPMRQAASDSHYRYVVTQAFPGYYVGQHVKFEPKSDSWLDDVGDAIAGGADFLADGVNWVSNAWDDIKAAAVSAAASTIPWCKGNEVCEKGLATGLDIGLAAMGVPPSIPNFDELSKMGKDYLIQTVAEEAGVPPEAAELAVDKMYELAKEHADGGGSAGGWLRPDPDFQYRPPFATIEVVSQSSTEQRDLQLVVQMYRFYQTKWIPLPPLRPGGRIVVPVNLDPPDRTYWRYQIEAERRAAGSQAFVSDAECDAAWWKSYMEEKTFLSASIVRTGQPAWRAEAHVSATFIASQGYPS